MIPDPTAIWKTIARARRSTFGPGDRHLSLVIALSLGAGLAVATAAFEIVNSELIRTPPFPAGNDLVSVQLLTSNQRPGLASTSVPNPPLLRAWRSGASGMHDLAGFQTNELALAGAGRPRAVAAVGVTPNVFALLGVRPLLGRLFSNADNDRGALPSLILSHKAWNDLFGQAPDAVGRRVSLNGQEALIVGVMPPGFRIPLSIADQDQRTGEIWVPINFFWRTQGLDDEPSHDSGLPLEVIGRLKHGESIATVSARLTALAHGVAGEPYAPRGAISVLVRRINEVNSAFVRTPILLAFLIAALLLLLSAFNAINLMHVRAVAREREWATRSALGAAPLRLLMEWTAECLLLSLAGWLLAVALLRSILPALIELGTTTLPDAARIAFDSHTAIFSLAAAAAVCIAESLWPFRSWLRRDRFEVLAGRPTDSRQIQRSMRAIATVQIAITVVVLSAAGVLASSFVRIERVNRGYKSKDVVVAGLLLPRERYATPDPVRSFRRRLLSLLRTKPHLASVAVLSGAPIVGGVGGLVWGDGQSGDAVKHTASVWSVGGDYFSALQIPVLTGRLPAFESGAGDVVLDETAARMLFGSQSPIGRRVFWGTGHSSGRVAAIAGNIQDLNVGSGDGSLLRRSHPHIYIPFSRDDTRVVRVVVRTDGNLALALDSLASAIAEVEPRVPSDISALDALLAESVAMQRLLLASIATVALVSLLVATGGIFALSSYWSARRTREIGVRLALGARPAGIVLVVLAGNLRIAAAGAILGLLATIPVTFAMRSILFEVSPADPRILAATAMLCLLSAAAAGAIPAARAARKANPVELLTNP